MLHSNCLICNSINLSKLDGYTKYSLVKCADCGFVFMQQIPTADELEKHYSNYSYSREQYLSPITIKNYNILLDEFEKYRSTNRLLDIGCGMGFFLEQAKKRGWEVYGTEYSTKAVEINRAKGINMLEGQLNSAAFSEKEFDIITSFEVIEHINNPQEEVKHIYNLLRNGGLFYCTTPNFNSILRFYLKEDYNVIGYPEHLSYYTKKTLNKLLIDNGFSKIKTYAHGISITRFETSKAQKNTTSEPTVIIGDQTADEKIRVQMDKKPYLLYAKNVANFFLSATGLGMGLKGYYEKIQQ